MKQMKNKGISLIVLIITIVVIIILAAAIILNLKDTNIINNANEAVVKQDFKTFQEELDLYIADKYVENLGELDITTIDATTKEDVTKIIPSIKGSGYEEYINIIDGGIVILDTMPEVQKEWANEVISSANITTIFKSQENVATVNSTFTGRGYAYNNPVIPAGFKISNDGAEWTEENGVVKGWNDGLVIVDASGNEFVWVPCTLDGTNGTIKYAKNLDYPKSSNTITSVSIDVDALPIKNETTRITETEHIAKYGGFYIGRYEAGVPDNQTTIDGTYGDGSSSKSDVDGIPVVKKGATVWTNISYENAMPNAKKLFEKSTSVRSGIVTGAAWDTACAWINSETDSEGKVVHDVTNSASWGNYSNTIGNAQYDTDGITKISNSKQKAGYSEYWKAKNIYDLAGNTWECTGEKYSTNRIGRGGNFAVSGSSTPASCRGSIGPSFTSDRGSFRIMLYVM